MEPTKCKLQVIAHPAKHDSQDGKVILFTYNDKDPKDNGRIVIMTVEKANKTIDALRTAVLIVKKAKGETEK